MFGIKKESIDDINQIEEKEEFVEETAISDQEEVAHNEDSVKHVKKSLLKPSVISEGFEFVGEVKSDGSVSIEGVFKGKMIVDHLIIGPNGWVEGSTVSRTINVKGRLSGDVVCDELNVSSQATIEASLTYDSIVIQRGGTVKGELRKK